MQTKTPLIGRVFAFIINMAILAKEATTVRRVLEPLFQNFSFLPSCPGVWKLHIKLVVASCHGLFFK